MENKNNIPDRQFAEALVSEIQNDFIARQNERRQLENQWQLNVNFHRGKQYSHISSAGDIREEEGGYYWQERNVYNHILPVIDTRVAKLSRVRPVMTVRAASDDDADIYTAQIASKVLNATCARIDEDILISRATMWSEITGTVFYRVGWCSDKGGFIGSLDNKPIFEGDVEVEVVSPFEIFPDKLTRVDVGDCNSIIRARVVSAEDIFRCYGVQVEGQEIPFFSQNDGSTAKDSALLIERYEKPNSQFPNGRIVTVASGKLLSIEEFPYINGIDGKRDYPFIRQISNSMPGCFFGCGIIDRLIPVQRAYNAVRNRKHEFLNRISLGVLAVEDGSCDVDALAEEGLQPGKIIVYRQGCEQPKMIQAESLPADFDKEEEKLLDEFVLLGGVNEVSQNYKATLGVTSAAGLQLLLEQDDERLTVSAENIRRAVRETARHIIRLFRQFTKTPRLMRIAGDGGSAEVFYFTSADLTGDDVIFETENELSYSPSQRRNNVLEIISSGILNGEDGRINQGTKAKLLELMGFGGLESGKSASAMHMARAAEENVTAFKSLPITEEYDDHDIHIAEHTRFLIGKEFARFENPLKVKEIIEKHLNEHKAFVLGASKPTQTGGESAVVL